MLETSAQQIWEKEVKPFVTQVYWNFKADEILVRELESLINHIDTDITAGRSFTARIEQVTKVINNPRYYDRFRNPADEQTVKELAEKLRTLIQVARYEDRGRDKAGEAPKVKERLPNIAPEEAKDLYSTPEVVKPRRF